MPRWLITRPAEDAAPLAEALAARGHAALVAPMFEVDFSAPEPADLTDIQAVLLTSANGARALAGLTPRRDVPVLAVGDATAAAARAAGFADVASAAGDAAALARLAEDRLDPAAGALFHAAGKAVAGDLKGLLEAAGFAVRRAVLYRTRAAGALPPDAAAALAGGTIAGVLFFSPRTAEVFVRLVRAAGLTVHLAGLYALCLSRAVAGRLDPAAWRTVCVAGRPNTPALLALLDDVAAGRAPEHRLVTQQEVPGTMAPQSDSPERDKPETPDADPPAGQDNPAERIIARFGGIRPMAHKLNVPVTTVQGWKKRGAIPESRHDDIRSAAAAHGVVVDQDELAAAVPDGEEHEEGAAEAPAAGAPRPEEAPPVGAGPAEPAAPDEALPAAADWPASGARRDAEEETDLAGIAAAERAAEAGAPGPAAERAEEPPAAGTVAAAAPWRPAAGRPEAERAEEREEEDEERPTGAPPPRGPAQQPPARGGGGGGGFALFLAFLALLVAAAALAMPWWAPRYVPEYWPGATETAVQDVESRLDEVAGRVGQTPTAQDVASLRERTDELESRVGQAPSAEQVAALGDRLADLESRIQALEQDQGLGGEQAQALAQQIERLQQDVNEAVTETESLTQRIQALRDQIGGEDAVAGLAEVQRRLADLETQGGAPGEAVAALEQNLAAVRETLSGLSERVAAQEGGPQAAALGGQIDRLTQRIDDLESSLEQADDRLAEVARRAEERQQRQAAEEALALAASELRRDLNAGAPYAVSFAAVLRLVAGDTDLANALRPLQEHADSGIPTETELARRFDAMAAEVRTAADQPESDAWWAQALNTMENVITVRPAPGEVEGDDPDAILARARYRLDNGNLAGAVEAVSGLTGAPAEAAQPWLADARARVAAAAVVEMLDRAAIERLSGGTTAQATGDGGEAAQ
jgi:uroporphyrinogen-III synthase